MGRWFPGIRKGTADQVRAYRDACVALWRNPDRAETPRYHMLNDRVIEAERPLSRAQGLYHFHGALNDLGRAEARERREARQQRNRARGR